MSSKEEVVPPEQKPRASPATEGHVLCKIAEVHDTKCASPATVPACEFCGSWVYLHRGLYRCGQECAAFVAKYGELDPAPTAPADTVPAEAWTPNRCETHRVVGCAICPAPKWLGANMIRDEVYHAALGVLCEPGDGDAPLIDLATAIADKVFDAIIKRAVPVEESK